MKPVQPLNEASTWGQVCAPAGICWTQPIAERMGRVVEYRRSVSIQLIIDPAARRRPRCG